MKKPNKSYYTFFGYILFFLTIAVTVTVAMLLYSYADEKSGGDQGTVAAVM